MRRCEADGRLISVGSVFYGLGCAPCRNMFNMLLSRGRDRTAYTFKHVYPNIGTSCEHMRANFYIHRSPTQNSIFIGHQKTSNLAPFARMVSPCLADVVGNNLDRDVSPTRQKSSTIWLSSSAIMVSSRPSSISSSRGSVLSFPSARGTAVTAAPSVA